MLFYIFVFIVAFYFNKECINDTTNYVSVSISGEKNNNNKIMMLQNRESFSTNTIRAKTLNTEHFREKDWLFYCDCCHPGEREANNQKPELPDPGFKWGF